MNTRNNNKELQFFNDEWNQQLKESYRLEIFDLKEKKAYSLDEYNKKFNNKNNKPDGRRYKK